MQPNEERRQERILSKKNKKADSANASDEIQTSKTSRSANQAPIIGMDAETEAAYFDKVVEGGNGDRQAQLFTELNLSRPFLRAVEAMGYTSPTPVQLKVIPLAMAGRGSILIHIVHQSIHKMLLIILNNYIDNK